MEEANNGKEAAYGRGDSAKLRQVDVLMAQRKPVGDTVQALGHALSPLTRRCLMYDESGIKQHCFDHRLAFQGLLRVRVISRLWPME